MSVKKTLKYLLKFALGCIGIFLVVMGNRRALGITSFGPMLDARDAKSIILQICMGLASLFLIAQFGLYTMSLLKKPPMWTARFLDLGLVRFLKERYRLQMSLRQQKIFSLTAWSAFVFLVVMLLRVIGAFPDSEMFLINDTLISGHIRVRAYEPMNDPHLHEEALAAPPVRYFQFATEDNNITKYFRDLYTIARDLKAAGAKVVVADLPDGALVPGLVNFVSVRPDLRAQKAQIDSLNIVVWSRPKMPASLTSFPRHVRLGVDDSHPYTVYSVQKKIPSTPTEILNQPIIRWQPLMRIDRVSGFPDYYADAAILAARKYFDIPDTCAIETDDAHVRIGNLTIPVAGDGLAYADNHSIPDFVGPHAPVMAQRGILFADGYEGHPDSLHYVNLWNSGLASAYTTVKDLLSYRSMYEGKAVLINWTPNNGETELLQKIFEANVLSSVLRKSFYTKIDWLTPVLSLLSIVLIALGSAFIRRARRIAYLSVVLMAGVIGIAVWLIFSYRILFEPVYPIIACAISGVIFMLAKLARDVRA